MPPTRDQQALARIRAAVGQLQQECLAYSSTHSTDADTDVHSFAETLGEMDLEYLEAAELALTRSDRARDDDLHDAVIDAEQRFQRLLSPGVV